jgi:hypothetical protein
LQQNAAALQNEAVLFDQIYRRRAWLFDRENKWIGGAAEPLHRTKTAARLARKADRRSQIDQSGVEITRRLPRHEASGMIPN